MEKYVPHFKPGKELRDRVNNGIANSEVQAESSERSTTANKDALQTNQSFDF